jgi:DNA-binding GntR family transcriptional regulator
MPLPAAQFSQDFLPTKQNILEILTRWIVGMQLLPEEKISDIEIAAYFHVSRTPVREVFQALERQKLVQSYPGKATIVTPIETQNIEQWYQPMQSLQCLATRIAVECASDTDIEELQLIEQAFCAQTIIETKNVAQLLELDRSFHNGILQIAGNPYIIDFCSMLWAHIQRLEYQFFRGYQRLETSIQDHERIIEGMQLRDPFMAEIAMKNNWNNTVLEIQALISRNEIYGAEKIGEN